jgi:hypothetical protein
MIAQKVQATTRYQDVTMEQGARAEDAAAQGEIFQFQSQEARTNADLKKREREKEKDAQQQNAAQIAGTQAWGQVASSVGGMVSSAMPHLPD